MLLYKSHTFARYNEYSKAACSFRMFERSCLQQRRLFTFVRHYASREVSCGILIQMLGPHKLFETFLFSPLSFHGLKPYFHRKYTLWDIVLSGIRLYTFKTSTRFFCRWHKPRGCDFETTEVRLGFPPCLENSQKRRVIPLPHPPIPMVHTRSRG